MICLVAETPSKADGTKTICFIKYKKMFFFTFDIFTVPNYLVSKDIRIYILNYIVGKLQKKKKKANTHLIVAKSCLGLTAPNLQSSYYS